MSGVVRTRSSLLGEGESGGVEAEGGEEREGGGVGGEGEE